MAKIYIETVEKTDDAVIVTAYLEGTVRIGTVFHLAQQSLEMQSGKRVALLEPTNDRPIALCVTKILAYEQEWPELTGRGAYLYLKGVGSELIHWGDVLSE
jgi:hypothetical protein